MGKILRDFLTIWTTIDPIGSLAIFSGLTASLAPAEQRRVAHRATIYAAVVLIAVVALG